MSNDIDEIRSALRAMLGDTSTPEHVVAAEDAGWNEGAWRVLRETGFAGIGVPESAGGSDGSLTEAAVVLGELGRASASVPYAEHALIAGWLAARAGKQLDAQVATAAVAPGLSVAADETLRGTVQRVPWARSADRIVVIIPDDDGASVAVLAGDSVAITPGRNFADEARDRVDLDGVAPVESWRIDADELEQVRLRTAFARAALIAGALARVLELTVRYTGERVQFGRPIGRFQAVQRHVVKTAEQTSLATMAVEAAAHGEREELDLPAAASAKIVASQAATISSAHSHQAHGAIGMTKEYELGQLSRRLWSWRDEGGTAQHWSRRLGTAVAAAGTDAVWPLVSSGTDAAARSRA